MAVYNAIVNITDILLGFLCVKVTFYISLACLAFGLVYFIARRAQRKDEKSKAVNANNILIASAVFFLASSLIYKTDVEGIKIMYCAIPAWFLLYLIYSLYLREFFVISVSCATGAVALFLLHKINFTAKEISVSLFSQVSRVSLSLVIALTALSVLLCVVVVMARKNHGKLKLYKWEIKLASGGANYLLCRAGALLPLAGLVISIIFAPAAIYMFYLLLAYFFCMFVYYTCQLMKK
jgi:hypothetical protein